ncbi:hypothetical protein [Alkalimonas sp.]|uniref:hypothetical protein n=1 Tax=Alkalimonas sp. TaxID=1872453 RepID=UPI00263BA598|nr:hypothetical protein [Alkalimonas sp.]MCC5825031.1 hypothetical protein [Alkalimonas sp.]
MSPSLPQQLSDTTLAAIVDHFELTEQTNANGGPCMTLHSQLPMVQGQVGTVRLFQGDSIQRLVTCSIVVPAMQLDSHMIFAFTASDSALPHFTLDSVKAGEHYSFHLDLIPRLDLAAHTDYMNEVFLPLTPLFQEAEAIAGITPAHITPAQRATMSPWMLVHRATEAGFKQVFPFVERYRLYWQELIAKGVTSSVSKAALAERDSANRAAIFSPQIDPVWQRIDGLIGQAAGEQLRTLLKSNH